MSSRTTHRRRVRRTVRKLVKLASMPAPVALAVVQGVTP